MTERNDPGRIDEHLPPEEPRAIQVPPPRAEKQFERAPDAPGGGRETSARSSTSGPPNGGSPS